tara:strand:+ start:709 stop:1440 length:732 start_codon:yes stop_codon:yes gene_type:complete
MIYASLTIIPHRIKSLNKTIDSLLKQTKKPDKIFINIPYAYKRFSEKIENEQLPKFNSKTIEITRCDDCGPGTKLLGSLNKLEKDSLLILVDDDNIYEDYMVEKFCQHFINDPDSCYSFYVHPLGNLGIGQGADGFAINTNHLNGIKKFYEEVVKDYKELFLYDDLWISYFLSFFKKKKILSLQNELKKDKDGKLSLIYKTHILAKGLISIYGKNLIESVSKRDKIAVESVKYMIGKTKDFKI